MVDTATARHLYERLEPLHAFIYFSPDANLGYAALGLEGQAGYFASRSAAMGRVGSEVVVATFFNFKASLVREALPAAWDITTPEAVLEARLAGADATIRKAFGDLIDHPDLPEVVELAQRAAAGCRPEGRPIYAAHAVLPTPEEPHLALFHAITLLREHRGDGHVAALTLEGLDNGEVLVTHALSGVMGLPEDILRFTRGFTEDEWDAVKAGLAARGLIGEDGALSEEGRAMRQRIEDRTDAAALAPWVTLGDAGCARLLEISAPFSRAIVKSGVFGGR